MRRIGIAMLLLTLAGCGKEMPVTKGNAPAESAGVELRRLALATPPSKMGFVSDSAFPTVYGVLTDWDVGGAVTIMSMRDGTASLYTTSKFGIIGGHGHDRVREAAVRYVKLADQYAKSSRGVTDFAYPKSGQVFFYLLTYDGVRLCVGNEDGIKRGSDPTAPLFAAAQEVLTELRRVTEERNVQHAGKSAETR